MRGGAHHLAAGGSYGAHPIGLGGARHCRGAPGRPTLAASPADTMQLGDNPPATRAVRVLTIDDQAIFRALARTVIEATEGFSSVGEAAGGEEGLEAVARLVPDLVLLDVRMPGMSGIEV